MTAHKVYKLGGHVLVRADCTKDGEFILQHMPRCISAIVTDPPYGVDYVAGKKDFKKRIGETQISKQKNIKGDEYVDDEKYAQFTRDWLDIPKEKMCKENSVYIFNADLMMCALRKGFADAGGYYSQTIIWVKDKVVIGRKDYLPQHELILYGWFGKHKFKKAKDRTVMMYPRPQRAKLHPTMKPVGLLRRLILNSTELGQWVYDPFGGSGSTLIACEHTKRRCFMVECDEEYVETTKERWERVSGRKAERIV